MGELGMCPATLLVDAMGAGEADVRAALEATAEAGFTDVSVWAHQLPLAGDAAAFGLRVVCLEAALSWPAADPTAEAEHFARLVAETGATKVLAVCMEPSVPHLDRAREHLAVLVDRVGAQVCVEFLPWSGIPDLATAWRLVEPLGPSATVLVDAWHWVRQPGGPDLDLLRSIPGERIGYVQVCDVAAAPGDDPMTEAMTNRLLPGEGVVDFGSLFGALADIGADPFVATEIFNPGFVESQGPLGAATAMREATLTTLGAWVGRP